MGAADDVQAYLAANSLVDGGTGWPSVLRRVHDETAKLVIITEDGGPVPQIPRAQGIGDVAMGEPGVQIMVRGEPWKSQDTMDQGQAILDLLHGLAGETIGSTDYIGVYSQTPEPIFLGFDEKHRPRCTVNVRMKHLL